MIRDTSPAEYHIDNLIDECSYILSGKCGDREQQRIDDLMDEMRGFAFQMRCTNAAWILSDRSRNGVKAARGWLRANFGTLTRQSPGTNVTASATSTATATASATVRMTVKAVQGSALSQEDKDALELAVSRMRDAAEEKDEQGFADKLAKALEVAKGAAGLVPAIVEAAGSLAGLF